MLVVLVKVLVDFSVVSYVVFKFATFISLKSFQCLLRCSVTPSEPRGVEDEGYWPPARKPTALRQKFPYFPVAVGTRHLEDTVV